MRIVFTISLILSALLIIGSCQKQNQQKEEASTKAEWSEEERKAWLDKGQNIAMSTFGVLSGELRAAMQRGGVSEAAQYCQLAALPIVDSLSELHHATIRRTSFKIRNPKDAPTAQESEMLAYYQEKIDQDEGLQPEVRREGGQVHFYAPIMTQELCLRCHGKVGETLKEEDYALIRELYPQDEAIGYQAGDWRGMWSISFAAEE